MAGSPPFIPYLGIHLTDLTFIGEGNKDVIGGKSTGRAIRTLIA